MRTINKQIVDTQTDIKISVCVPVYGVEKYIEKCARTLFEQTYDNLEIIFVNDATKDRSIEIVNQVLTDYPQRANQTRIIEHETNKGLAMARCTAVSHATGEFVFHLDSDDYLEPKAIESLVNCIDSDNVDIVSGSIYNRFPTRTTTYIAPREDNPKEIARLMVARQIPTNIWNRLIRRGLYDGLEIPAINNGEDYVTTNRLFWRAKNVKSTQVITYDYNRLTAGSYGNYASQSNRADLNRSIDFLKQAYVSEPEMKDVLAIGALIGIVSILLTCKDLDVLRTIKIPQEYKPYITDYRLGKSRYILLLHKWRLYRLIQLASRLYYLSIKY